jgi:hypothetical protein
MYIFYNLIIFGKEISLWSQVAFGKISLDPRDWADIVVENVFECGELICLQKIKFLDFLKGFSGH